MDDVERATSFSERHLGQRILVSLLSLALFIATGPQNISAKTRPRRTRLPKGHLT